MSNHVSNFTGIWMITSILLILYIPITVYSIPSQPSSSSAASSAAAAAVTSSSANSNSIPFVRYNTGSPNLLPNDILYHKPTRMALQTLREQYYQQSQNKQQQQQEEEEEEGTQISQESNSAIKKSIDSLYEQKNCNDHGITLTLVGYKGRGAVQDQINQDRAFIRSPFTLSPPHTIADDSDVLNDGDGDDDSDSDRDSDNNKVTLEDMNNNNVMQLMGVMDGHGNLGEHASEHCVLTIPKLLNEKIINFQSTTTITTTTSDDVTDDATDDVTTNGDFPSSALMENIFKDIFLSVNATIPNGNGGCTASILFRMNNQVYIANVGDSRTFLFSYQDNVNNDNNDENENGNGNEEKQPINKELDIKMIYQSREDKPHLKGEKYRVEKCGGIVYQPPLTIKEMQLGHTSSQASRVVVSDKEKGYQLSLAMSRSIGDWVFSNYGVIAEPIVDVIDLDKVIPLSPSSSSSSSSKGSNNKNIKIFAVSATDGLLDYVTPKDIGDIIGKALHGCDVDDTNNDDMNSVESTKAGMKQNGSTFHTSSAVEELILRAAQGWYNEMGQSYRDDIAIAAMRII